MEYFWSIFGHFLRTFGVLLGHFWTTSSTSSGSRFDDCNLVFYCACYSYPRTHEEFLPVVSIFVWGFHTCLRVRLFGACTKMQNAKRAQRDNGATPTRLALEKLWGPRLSILCPVPSLRFPTHRPMRSKLKARRNFPRDIFFCLKTNWRRVGVKRQKKISFCGENSA